MFPFCDFVSDVLNLCLLSNLCIGSVVKEDYINPLVFLRAITRDSNLLSSALVSAEYVITGRMSTFLYSRACLSVFQNMAALSRSIPTPRFKFRESCLSVKDSIQRAKTVSQQNKNVFLRIWEILVLQFRYITTVKYDVQFLCEKHFNTQVPAVAYEIFPFYINPQTCQAP